MPGIHKICMSIDRENSTLTFTETGACGVVVGHTHGVDSVRPREKVTEMSCSHVLVSLIRLDKSKPSASLPAVLFNIRNNTTPSI